MRFIINVVCVLLIVPVSSELIKSILNILVSVELENANVLGVSISEAAAALPSEDNTGCRVTNNRSAAHSHGSTTGISSLVEACILEDTIAILHDSSREFCDKVE